MIFIDASYFVRELYIPNIHTLNKSSVVGMAATIAHSTNNTSIEEFAKKYEYQFLVKVLGKELADHFLNNIEEDDWQPLVSLLIDCERKTSPIANYIYYYWAMNNQTQTTNVGSEVTGTPDGTRSVREARKLITVWNEMVDYVKMIFQYLDCDQLLIPQHEGLCLGRDYSLCRTMNEFGL